MLKPLGINIWKAETLPALAAKILQASPKPLVLIDGKGGAGKTTFATMLAAALDASLIASDDIAWWADPIHWDNELLQEIIRPWLNGESVAYTPSGWRKKNRKGTLNASANKALIIEGSGTCRKSLRHHANYTIWMETDPKTARNRVIQRDLTNGENGNTIQSITNFTDQWDATLDPFLAQETPWKHANAIINGEVVNNTEANLLIHHPSKPLLT